ncbi:MAG: hypothetical protein QOG50_766, partial [Actinomycetota bacterium]|nr:hypothetical protein [Actinomycetota bacterium]
MSRHSTSNVNSGRRLECGANHGRNRRRLMHHLFERESTQPPTGVTERVCTHIVSRALPPSRMTAVTIELEPEAPRHVGEVEFVDAAARQLYAIAPDWPRKTSSMQQPEHRTFQDRSRYPISGDTLAENLCHGSDAIAATRSQTSV